jgi:hypothetical protein
VAQWCPWYTVLQGCWLLLPLLLHPLRLKRGRVSHLLSRLCGQLRLLLLPVRLPMRLLMLLLVVLLLGRPL